MMTSRAGNEVWSVPRKASGGSKQTHSEGFTLLEVVLVILIMALAVGISYPSLTRGSSSFELRAAGREILNTLRYAREKAITEQRRLMVVIDREAQKVVFSDEFGEGAKMLAMPHHVRIAQVALAGHELPRGPLVIHYLPNGSSENAEILLNSDRGAALRIVTDPMTGGARIYTGQGEKAP